VPQGKPFFNTGVPDPDALVLSLAVFYGIPPSLVEDIPLAKLLRIVGEIEKKLSELRGSMLG
jgi:hypothetical protein